MEYGACIRIGVCLAKLKVNIGNCGGYSRYEKVDFKTAFDGIEKFFWQPQQDIPRSITYHPGVETVKQRCHSPGLTSCRSNRTGPLLYPLPKNASKTVVLIILSSDPIFLCRTSCIFPHPSKKTIKSDLPLLLQTSV